MKLSSLKHISQFWGIKMTYGAMGAAFIAFENYSVFLFFFALLVELIFMVITYLIFHIKKEGFSENIITLVGSTALISVIAYFLAYFAATKFDIAELVKYRTRADFLLPVRVYIWAIIWLILGLIVSYYQYFQELRFSKSPIIMLQARLIRHVMLVYGVGILIGGLLYALPAKEWRFFIMILPISRILMDYYLAQKIIDK